MVTPFGKAVKKFRIDRGDKLIDMAEKIGVKSSYLSAIETGKKRITDSAFNMIAGYFGNSKITEELRLLIEVSQPECNIGMSGRTDSERELVVAFARKFSDLTPESKSQLERILNMN